MIYPAAGTSRVREGIENRKEVKKYDNENEITGGAGSGRSGDCDHRGGHSGQGIMPGVVPALPGEGLRKGRRMPDAVLPVSLRVTQPGAVAVSL